MKSARLPMNNQISGKQVLKLSMPISQTEMPPKVTFGKLPRRFYLWPRFVRGVPVGCGVMKLQAELLNVFLKSITQNAMPRRARVWECNYDQFES